MQTSRATNTGMGFFLNLQGLTSSGICVNPYIKKTALHAQPKTPARGHDDGN
jgi:hypothetical protein